MQKLNPADSTVAVGRAGWFTRFKRRWRADRERLISIQDTPHSIALGVAIGIFFGFTPLWTVKTLLSIGVAWLFKCNKIAAAISVTLHDAILPFMPVVYWWEYKLGYWILHATPPHRIRFSGGGLHDLFNWSFFVRIVWPTLVGSIFFGLLSAVAIYFLARWTVKRTRAHRQARAVLHSHS